MTELPQGENIVDLGEQGPKAYDFKKTMGRPRKIKDAEELWLIFEEYQKYMANRFWFKPEVIKGGDLAGAIIDTKVQYPWSIESFCIFAGISRRSTWDTYFTTREGDDPGKVDEFQEVARIIQDIIADQQLSGASVGAYSSSIVAARLGMIKKSEVSGPDGGPIQLKQITGMEIK